MALNYIWISFFLIAFVVALVKLIFFHDFEVFSAMFDATMDSSKLGFEISLGLTGVLTFWLGILKIGENGGMIKILTKLVRPFFERIFPDIPKGHPVYGHIMMNISANMLNLDNAATPMGLKAMNDLQDLNPDKDKASNPMIMFLVLNTTGLTLIPINVMVYRAQLGAANPADVFLPILIATFFATLTGLILVGIVQKINLFDKVVLAYLLSATAIILGMVWYFYQLPPDQIQIISRVVSHLVIFIVIVVFILMGIRAKVNIYESFIEGAKDGFGIAIKIIPYLIAILVSIGVFRASGALDYIISGISWMFASLGFNTDFVPALPTAFMKPLTGSGARAMMIETMNTYGADSFAGKIASVLQGSTDTTFYIIAVYFGSVGIRKTRYAVTCGLIADLVGIVVSILIGYLFFYHH